MKHSYISLTSTYRTRLREIALYSLGMLLLILAIAPQADATVLWRGDPAAGRSAWKAEHMVSPTRTTVATIGGRSAWRMQINDGDNFGGHGERTEFGQDGNSTRVYRNGNDVWFGYSIYLPSDFPTNVRWTALTQMKDQSPDLGSPSWGTYVESGKIGIHGVLAPGGLFWRPAALNTWHNFVMHYKLGTSASTGRIEAFYSTGSTQPALVYAGNRQTYRTSSIMVPRMGYYRDKALTGNAAVYHAGFRAATSFVDANPLQGISSPPPTEPTSPTPTPPSNVKLQFLRYDGGSFVRSLTNGLVVAKSSLPAGVDIEAIGPTGTGSIRLCLNGTCRIENNAKYTMDNTSDNLPLNLPLGKYTMTATAYSLDNALGSTLGSVTVTFTVTS